METVLDFGSALYLGLGHPSAALEPWPQLTLGAPAAAVEPPGAVEVAEVLAHLQGCAEGVLGTSTLHVFWDLFGMLARDQFEIFLDAGAYPIARWGVERAAAFGTPVQRFPHRRHDLLRAMMLRSATPTRRPVLVTDGYCPLCGSTAPLSAYQSAIRERRGLLIFDDTQALGIHGASPTPENPYGDGGGGSLQRTGVHGDDIIVISSLAKGFGAPVAAIAGPREWVERFVRSGETRTHCSPPSVASIAAARRALRINAGGGAQLRARLLSRVREFRAALRRFGMSVDGDSHPVQSFVPSDPKAAPRIHAALQDRGVRTVLRRGHNGVPGLSFLFSAAHRPGDPTRAAQELFRVVASNDSNRRVRRGAIRRPSSSRSRLISTT